MHAETLATLYNAHFDAKGDPWTADDLLGNSNREQRQRDRMKDRLNSFRHSGFAQKVNKNADVPEWATNIEKNRKARVN